MSMSKEQLNRYCDLQAKGLLLLSAEETKEFLILDKLFSQGFID